jgi:nitrogen regulatory protein P-II 2
MKYIIAVIQPDRLNEVLDELERREIHLVTVTQVMGRASEGYCRSLPRT